ncbi:MAG: peptide-methionine (S)-S-oxide reductase MsrA [Steroidobacteraceae bacterium]
MTAGAVSLAATALAATFLGWFGPAPAAEPSVALPAPVLDRPKHSGPLETAVLAGGCFWGMQGVFEHVRGVHRVLAGYSGGAARTARYDDVGLGNTGHAESVEIAFDPGELSYGELLQIYFSVAHDPTELDRQGPDSGSQYRSDIFYADETQRQIAASYIAQLDRAASLGRPLATRVDALKGFYPAEGYHQDFYLRNPDNPYIEVNDLPKIRRLQQLFPGYYRNIPATVAR